MAATSTDHYLHEIIRLADALIQLAYQGDAEREDVGCGVVFGSVRDKAYKVKRLAVEEIARHRALASGPRAIADSPDAVHTGAPPGAPRGE